MKENSKRNYLIVILAFILFLMSTGYALFNNLLHIEAEGSVKTNLKIVFDTENYVTSGSALEKENSPIISANSIVFNVEFVNDQDNRHYDFYVVNEGNISGKLYQIAIEEIEKNEDISLTYKVKDSDNNVIYDSSNDVINQPYATINPNEKHVIEVDMIYNKTNALGNAKYRLEFQYRQD